MRPLRPFCGTVLKAQLLTLPATISTSANGVVTTQLSFLPPASSRATEVFGSSDSRPATVQPPEPPPTTTKSNVSLTPVPPICPSMARAFSAVAHTAFGRLLRQSSAFTLPMARSVPRGGFGAFWASQKPQKPHHGPFQSRLALIHTPRTQGLARVAFSGSLWTGPIDAKSVGRFRFQHCFSKGHATV